MSTSRVWVTLERATTIATLLAACLVAWLVVERLSDRRTAGSPPRAPADWMPVKNPFKIALDDHARRQGTPKVAVIEFSDYLCKFCGAYARDTFPRVEREFVQTGKIAYSVRHLPLGGVPSPSSRFAEVAACAAQQGKFWPMHSRLFALDRQTSNVDLTGDAAAAGADRTTLGECVNSGLALGHVQEDAALAQKFNVTSTPTFFIGTIDADGVTMTAQGAYRGAPGFELLKNGVERLLTGQPEPSSSF
jgi:Na+:H+ antiporter, NhaA family